MKKEGRKRKRRQRRRRWTAKKQQSTLRRSTLLEQGKQKSSLLKWSWRVGCKWLWLFSNHCAPNEKRQSLHRANANEEDADDQRTNTCATDYRDAYACNGLCGRSMVGQDHFVCVEVFAPDRRQFDKPKTVNKAESEGGKEATNRIIDNRSKINFKAIDRKIGFFFLREFNGCWREEDAKTRERELFKIHDG